VLPLPAIDFHLQFDLPDDDYLTYLLPDLLRDTTAVQIWQLSWVL